VDRLSVQVGGVDEIRVDQYETPDSGLGEREDRCGAQGSDTNHQDRGAGKDGRGGLIAPAHLASPMYRRGSHLAVSQKKTPTPQG
jgi:hypothetical protein